MEDKELPMDYFAPIITIDEKPPLIQKTVRRIKKIKIKIEPNEEGEMSGEIVKPKRGRPRKNPDKVNQKKRKKKKKERNDEEWCCETKKKKKTKKKKTKELEQEFVPKVVIKSEPVDENDSTELAFKKDDIKTEIKEESNDDVLCVEVPIPEHVKTTQTDVDDKKFNCPLCTKEQDNRPILYSQKELKQHYKQSHPGKRLRLSRFSTEVHPCDICGKEFRTSGAVKDHMETHNNYYYCEICNASQKKIVEHVIHLRVHSPDGLFRCLLCEFNTPSINEITEHVNGHEDSFNRYWCSSCKKGFRILSWFQEHDNYHTGLKPFDCEFCGKCFLYSRYLHAHKINIHPRDIDFPSLHQCVICGKRYQHKNSLKLHMNSHTGNFSVCDICGKMLSSKEKLKFHIRTHTGYKPYACPYCEKCFTKKPILVEHIRIHTGERPYVCEYCEKAFSQRSSLVIHTRGHTGEKPYVCQFCTKGFVSKAMLNIHLRSCKGFLLPRANV